MFKGADSEGILSDAHFVRETQQQSEEKDEYLYKLTLMNTNGLSSAALVWLLERSDISRLRGHQRANHYLSVAVTRAVLLICVCT